MFLSILPLLLRLNILFRFLLSIFCILSLFSCSSSVGRAPVSDITQATNSRSGTDIAYPSKGNANKNGSGANTYTVKKGDTLYAIAWNTSGDVKDLITRNNIKSPYVIKEGQVLYLTGTKPDKIKKINNKSDLASQNVIKNSHTGCTAQNCYKKPKQEVAREKTKAYSANKTNGNNESIKTKTTNKTKISGWSWPVKGRLTKQFSASQSAMQGISIVNKRGTPIHAAAPGKVVYAGSGLRGYGNLIIIKHNDDYLSAYAHNEKLLVSENENIKMGQKIALMGDTGTDHIRLHFEIRFRGKSVDPLRYLPKR